MMDSIVQKTPFVLSPVPTLPLSSGLFVSGLFGLSGSFGIIGIFFSITVTLIVLILEAPLLSVTL